MIETPEHMWDGCTHVPTPPCTSVQWEVGGIVPPASMCGPGIERSAGVSNDASDGETDSDTSGHVRERRSNGRERLSELAVVSSEPMVAAAEPLVDAFRNHRRIFVYTVLLLCATALIFIGVGKHPGQPGTVTTLPKIG